VETFAIASKVKNIEENSMTWGSKWRRGSEPDPFQLYAQKIFIYDFLCSKMSDLAISKLKIKLLKNGTFGHF
jgi:hypothetical protein